MIDKIANLDNVLFWHRNPSRIGFKINGYVNNHYPDFIVVTKKRNVILVETKGRQLDGSDSEYKIEIGRNGMLLLVISIIISWFFLTMLKIH